MYDVITTKFYWIRFLTISIMFLSGCQKETIYSNFNLGFTLSYPKHWELVEERVTEVEFRSKYAGDAVAVISIENEFVQPSSKESLSEYIDTLLSSSQEEISSMVFSKIDHEDYDIAMAHLTYSNLEPFQYNYYLVIIQLKEQQAVLRVAGDGSEPIDMVNIFVENFQFIP